MIDDKSKTPMAKYLSFHLGNEEYGVDIKLVKEIRSYEEITAIPKGPPFIRGIISLRGAIVPIVDLGLRLNLSGSSSISSSVLVILDIGSRVFGVLVDRVSDVVSLDHEKIQPAPKLADEVGNHVIGISVSENRMMTLLNVEDLVLRGSTTLFPV